MPRKPEQLLQVEIPSHGPERLQLLVDIAVSLRDDHACPECGGLWGMLDPGAGVQLVDNVLDRLAELSLKRRKGKPHADSTDDR